MRLFGMLLLGVVALLSVAGVWMQFESAPPLVTVADDIKTIGRNTPLQIDVHTGRQGLRAVHVRLRVGEGEQAKTYPLFDEELSPPGWFQAGVTDKRVEVQADTLQLKVPEGAAILEVFAPTYAWHILGAGDAPTFSAPITVDLTPPKVELLTSQHNLRLGGAELAVFRISPDTVRSGIAVGDFYFPATKGFYTDPDIALAFFAVPQNLGTDARARILARDAAGNEREVSLPVRVAPQKFADKTLNIDDNFLQRKVPDIESASHLTRSTDLVQGYLTINRELRAANEKTLKQVCATSKPVVDWDGAFHRQTNAAPLSSFADRRTYVYNGKTIDHQTHLGFDLASLKLAVVESTQNGTVVFADDLGIYGNTVVIDHGLGIFSLYGHMSTMTVKKGDVVKKGQGVGQSGETGLAGGDHIHYSIMLYGVHIDPVEWWDPHWLKDHVLPKFAMFPRATAK